MYVCNFVSLPLYHFCKVEIVGNSNIDSYDAKLCAEATVLFAVDYKTVFTRLTITIITSNNKNIKSKKEISQVDIYINIDTYIINI